MSACFVHARGCVIIRPSNLIPFEGDVILIGCENRPPDLFSPGVNGRHGQAGESPTSNSERQRGGKSVTLLWRENNQPPLQEIKALQCGVLALLFLFISIFLA